MERDTLLQALLDKPSQGEQDTPIDEVDLGEINDHLLQFLNDDIVKHDLLQGVDLQKYAQDLDLQLLQSEQSLVQDYTTQKGNIDDLHTLLVDCDDTLKDMEGMLSGFQTQLGSISSEIKNLQDLSLDMNIGLGNRREAQFRLSSFIEGVCVPPELVVGICEGPLDERYVELLAMLEAKQLFVAQQREKERQKRRNSANSGNYTTQDEVGRKKSHSENHLEKNEKHIGPISSHSGNEKTRTTVMGAKLDQKDTAADNVSDTIAQLFQHAIFRVHKFIHSHILALQTPHTNIQIKQGVLQRSKPLFRFLQVHQPDSAEGLVSFYEQVLGKLYLAEFQKFISLLSVDETLSIGKGKGVHLSMDFQSEAKSSNLLFFSKQNSKQKKTQKNANESDRKSALLNLRKFALEDRDSVLHPSKAQEVALFLKMKQDTPSFRFEQIFSGLLLRLTSACSSEYLFLTDFFSQPSPSSNENTTSVFLAIFSRTFSLVLQHLEDFLFTTSDGLALILMIGVLRQTQRVMISSGIACLSHLLERMNILIWPRLTSVWEDNMVRMDMEDCNVDSMLVVRFSGWFTGLLLVRKLELGSASNCNIANSGTADSINDMEYIPSGKDATNSNSKTQLFDVIVEKAYSTFYNCVSKTGTCDSELDGFTLLWSLSLLHNQLEGKQVVFPALEKHLGQAQEAFIDNTLKKVPEFRAVMDSLGEEGGIDTGVLVDGFNRAWKKGLEVVYERVHAYNWKCSVTGTSVEEQSVLKKVLVQLIVYYRRFRDMLGGVGGLVDEKLLRHEIKRYGTRQ